MPPTPTALRWVPTLAITAVLVSLTLRIAAAERPAYDLRVRLDPALGTIDAHVDISQPGSSTFLLARDLAIHRVVADGVPTRFEEGVSETGGARTVTVPGPPPNHLIVEYGGHLRPGSFPRLTSQVNMVGPALVELASYVTWYPRFRASGAFTFRLTTDVPVAFNTVANGRLLREEERPTGRRVAEWVSHSAVSDITIVSAPGLHPAPPARDGTQVEIYSTSLPADYVAAMTKDVSAAVRYLQRMAGASAVSHHVKIVYSPRPGWGYARQPLIVVSEENARAATGQPYGRARDLRYLVHEAAHDWWHQADAATPEDWINEGLAEYSALLACRATVGPEFADVLVAEYAERSASSPSANAILETDGGSPDRELNRYVRPVLMFEEVRRRHGDERMTGFLRALHARFVQAGHATTGALLDEAEAHFGSQGREDIRLALHRTDWRPANAAPAYVFSARDAVWLGTWTGTLTQGSITNAVVLRLLRRGNQLAGTLDHPDPSAPAIPLSAVRIDEDTLLFALGAFGISFKGRLETDATVMHGEWTQGGASYSLKLTRREPGTP